MADNTLIMPDGVSIRVERDYEEVWSWTPELDPGWVFTDKAGHTHRGSRLQDTLDWVVTYPGGAGPDGEEYPDEGEYRCVTCGEVVVPGTRTPLPKRVVVAEYYFINDQQVTKEEALAIAERYRGSASP